MRHGGGGEDGRKELAQRFVLDLLVRCAEDGESASLSSSARIVLDTVDRKWTQMERLFSSGAGGATSSSAGTGGKEFTLRIFKQFCASAGKRRKLTSRHAATFGLLLRRADRENLEAKLILVAALPHFADFEDVLEEPFLEQHL